jgi:ADP-heptose:LPS heptosyltransferase
MKPHRVAVFRALNLGDMVVSIPALRRIRRSYPDAGVTLIALPWAEQFAAQVPGYIDRFEPFQGYPGIREVPFDPEVSKEGITRLREQRFDVALQLHGDGSVSNGYVAQLKSTISVGPVPPQVSGTIRLDIDCPYPSDMSEVESLIAIAALICPVEAGAALELPVFPHDVVEAGRLLGDSQGPYIALHASAAESRRMWPAERFVSTALSLREAYGFDPVLVGAQADWSLCQRICDQLPGMSRNLAGKTSFATLAAVIAGAQVFIGNDSGPTHVAQAVGTPSVTLFGPGIVERWGHADERNRIVRTLDGSGMFSVHAIEVADVVAAARSLLGAHRLPSSPEVARA